MTCVKVQDSTTVKPVTTRPSADGAWPDLIAASSAKIAAKLAAALATTTVTITQSLSS